VLFFSRRRLENEIQKSPLKRAKVKRVCSPVVSNLDHPGILRCVATPPETTTTTEETPPKKRRRL
jgi:hypothetical protein